MGADNPLQGAPNFSRVRRLARAGLGRARYIQILCVAEFTRRFGTAVDMALGVDTGGFATACSLGLTSPDAHGFAASPWFTLRRILPPQEVSADDVFLDVGAGKGRIVLSAALLYSFRRVVGIELSADLANIARRNIQHVNHRLRCRNVVIVEGDASESCVADDVTVIYVYDPFEGATFGGLVTQLLESLDRHPRRVRVIYRAPMQEATLLKTGRARILRRAHGFCFRWDGAWAGLALFEVT